MSNAKRCDRCKSYYDPITDKAAPSFKDRPIYALILCSLFTQVGDPIDLCPKCANELIRWLDSYSYMPAPINYDLPIEGDVKEVSYDRNVSRPSVTGDEKDQDGSGEDSKESRED